ncbi:MAG: zinc carboxypeptidase [Gemmatimonadales bacterium]|nr:MAG: zinc carboxypeptidase [Gemmatimonadales bacterium]
MIQMSTVGLRHVLVRCGGAAFLAALVLGPVTESAAQTPAAAWEAAVQPLDYFFPEGQTFNPDIPSPQEFLGYELGTYHTRHDMFVAYMEELARRSDRATYQSLGRSIGLRELPVLTITSPANHARLEEIRTEHLLAADPREPRVAGADRPIVVHLGFGVHGNEPSASDAALLAAYWLVAGENPEVVNALEQGVWHVEPVLNPDGRDRHSTWANMHRSSPFVADPLDREHTEVWPGGRTNHYWFDLNRDWLPLQDPSSRARIDFHHSWKPNVVADYHEMGTNSTYFFEPTKPEGSWNPLLPEELYTDITLRFADRWAGSLDEIGSLYFTKEVFDNTYPGYGSTYPNFLGGLGLVFEQASARGHIQESTHHGVLTFAYAIRNQFRTVISTVESAVAERERMLEYQRDFYESALTEGAAFPVRAWVFGSPHDHSLNREFLDLLLRHRIEVFQLAEDRSLDGGEFQAGESWIVPVEQPEYRLVRSMFERTDTYADSVFYDASTWTMSLAYGIPHGEIRSGGLPLGDPVVEVPAPRGTGDVPTAQVAYLLDWSDTYAPRALQYLMARGVRAEGAFQPFSARVRGGEAGPAGATRSFPRGSISIPVQIQHLDPGEVHRLVREAETHTGVPFFATDTSLSTDGVDLGSGNFRPLGHMPRVLMVVGSGIQANEAGQVWHLLDTRVDLPVTKVDRDNLGRADLSRYDVVVLVSGNYGFMGEGQQAELRRFVQRGGTLVGIRGGAQWALAQGFAPRVNQALAQVEAEAGMEVGRTDYADAAALTGAQRIRGSIYRADLDSTHPLGFGYHSRELAVWRDHEFIVPPSANPFSTPVQLTEDPHLSGYISPRNLDRIRGSASALTDGIGSGTVVLLLDNPNFRGYWYGTNRLFLNAIFFGRHISVPAAP